MQVFAQIQSCKRWQLWPARSTLGQGIEEQSTRHVNLLKVRVGGICDLTKYESGLVNLGSLTWKWKTPCLVEESDLPGTHFPLPC